MDVLHSFVVHQTNPNQNLTATCKYCDKSFTAPKSRLLYHLACISKQGITCCPKVPRKIQENLYNQTKRSKRAAPETSDPFTSDAPNSEKQKTIWQCNKLILSRTADLAWARFAHAEGIPFHKFDSPWFKKAIEDTIKAGSTYKVPSSYNVGGPLLDELTISAQKTLHQHILKDAEHTGQYLLFF